MKTAFSYVEKDPEKRLLKIMDWVDRFAPEGEKGFSVQRKASRDVIEDKDNNMHQLMLRVFNDTDQHVLETVFENFIVNGNLVGWPKQLENAEKYGCNIPWAILLDPTGACNLHCVGCWAAEYQFHNMQLAAEQNGWTLFSTMQNHYNLLYREDERELIPICRQYGVSLIPYSPLAAGRLSRLEWNTDTARSQTDKVAISKYDSTQEQDYEIVKKVAEVAEKHTATMSQIAIAWHYAKGVTAPIIGATKPKYFDDAAAAVDLELSAEDIAALEECYVPHKIVGAL